MSEDSGGAGTALVVEGGGMRGIFTAGVLDVFAEEGLVPFDLYIGVSAGALTLSSYLAGQAPRNRKVLTGACMSPEFLNFRRWLGGGHWIDMDWAFRTWEREQATDIEAALAGLVGRRFLVTATAVETAEAVYLQPGRDDWLDCLRATSALPVYYRNFISLGGRELVDGSVAAPIPVAEALAQGCRRVVVLRTRPPGYRAKLGTLERFIAFKVRRHPALQQAGYRHPGLYNAALDLMARPPDGVELLEVGPPVALRTGRTRPSAESLSIDYRAGRDAALRALPRVHGLLSP